MDSHWLSSECHVYFPTHPPEIKKKKTKTQATCLNSEIDRLLYIVTKVRHEQSMGNRTITPKVQKRGL